MEAEHIAAVNSTQQPDQHCFTNIFDAVRKGTKEQVKREFLGKTSTGTGTEAREGGPEEITNQATGSITYRQKLLKALEKKDAGEVLNLIVEGKKANVKTLENLNEVCESVAEYERRKEERLVKFLAWKCGGKIRKCGSRCCSHCLEGTAADEQPTNSSLNEQQQTGFQNKDEQEWINILSDPLYIGLEWLWRTNPHSKTTSTSSNSTDERVEPESNLDDVIEAALRNAHLLDKIASYEHHYSRDEYTRRAEIYEKFAADVVEESTDLEQLHTIMDVEGTGCLLKNKPDDFNQSLSLLKIAADKKRKKVCVIPCHYVSVLIDATVRLR